MTADDKEKMKKWVQGWARAAEALREIKRRELRAYDYSQNREVVDGMLRWACEHRRIRLTSGLVEQQRLLGKMRSARS